MQKAKYRYKYPEIQRQLDWVSNGDFSKQLNGAIAVESTRRTPFDDIVIIRYGTKLTDAKPSALTTKHIFCLEPSDVEEIKYYNPDTWNDYPEVEPPKDTIFQVEAWIHENEGTPEAKHLCVNRFAAVYDGTEFIPAGHYPISNMRSDVKLKYRAWK